VAASVLRSCENLAEIQRAGFDLQPIREAEMPRQETCKTSAAFGRSNRENPTRLDLAATVASK